MYVVNENNDDADGRLLNKMLEEKKENKRLKSGEEGRGGFLKTLPVTMLPPLVGGFQVAQKRVKYRWSRQLCDRLYRKSK